MSAQKNYRKICIITDCESAVKVGHERYGHVESGEVSTRA
jgi:hypothetical protein